MVGVALIVAINTDICKAAPQPPGSCRPGWPWAGLWEGDEGAGDSCSTREGTWTGPLAHETIHEPSHQGYEIRV